MEAPQRDVKNAGGRSTAPRWLILHGGALGDLVLTLQLALRLGFGREGGGIHVMARANPGNLAECRPGVTWQFAETAGLHRLYVDSGIPASDPLAALIRGSRLLSSLGNAASLVHRQIAALGPERLWSFDPRPRAGLRGHITEQWAADLRPQGAATPACDSGHPPGCRLEVPESFISRGADILEAAAGVRSSVLIHPGGGGRRKCWPRACFRQVARELARRGKPPAFVIGPAERDTWTAAEITELGRRYPLIDSPDSDTLARILAAAAAVVANDSGPAHLAAFLCARTVVVFGPTSPELWRPLGERVHIMAGDPDVAADWGVEPTAVAAMAAG